MNVEINNDGENNKKMESDRDMNANNVYTEISINSELNNGTDIKQ